MLKIGDKVKFNIATLERINWIKTNFEEDELIKI